MKALVSLIVVLSINGAAQAQQAVAPLIVVEDRGGVSALPYYRSLHLSPEPTSQAPPILVPPRGGVGEAAMLPVRSIRLTPGAVEGRAIHVPGLTPLFLIGDDDRSRAWLQQRLSVLQKLKAVGLVVNVASQAALQSLRERAPGLRLAPVSGDDLAERLELRHYPVLITATGIEQ